MNRIVAALSKLLEPMEREYVCGDLEELQLSTPAAFVTIIGLVTRRQLAQWSHWGPWIALVGIAGLVGFSLSGSVSQLEIGLFRQIRTYLTYGVAYQPGGVSVAQQIAYTATSIAAVLLWFWACGFVLASLSRRALWMTLFLFYAVVRDSWAFRMATAGHIVLKHSLWGTMLFGLLPLDPLMLVFLLTMAIGIRSARKGTLRQTPSLYLAAAGVLLVIFLAWMKSWFAAGFAHWSGQTYVPTPFLYRVLPLLACAWPIFVIPLVNHMVCRNCSRMH